MLFSMRRLHSRGSDCRGIAVDSDGATLGPDCVLVRRTPAGFRCLDPAAADVFQKAAFGFGTEPDWLFEQCRRIAEALAKGEVALAQIHGLRIPVGDLDDAALRKLAATARLLKAGFDPNQPRVPAGNPDGGQWTDAGGSDEDAGSADSDDEGWPAETSDDVFDEDESFGTEDYEPDGGSEGSSDRSPPPDSGGDDPPRIPSEQPRTTRVRNRIARRSAEWLARAIALGLAEQAESFWRIVETTAWLAGNLPAILSYRDDPKTLDELRDAAARPRLGYERHHIVERQYGSVDPISNWSRFGDRLDSRENLARIPYWKHVEISSWYSTFNDDFNGLTPRDYLRGKSWDEHYKVGLEAMRIFGVLK
jgi:hypothetical protein